jgi:hypothetical protein
VVEELRVGTNVSLSCQFSRNRAEKKRDVFGGEGTRELIYAVQGRQGAKRVESWKMEEKVGQYRIIFAY